MPTSEELQTKFATYKEEKLLGILAKAEDYLPDALEQAEAELKKRGIDEEKIAWAKDKGDLGTKEAKILAEEPLSNLYKWFYFLGAPLSFTPALFFFVSYWSKKGYLRRSKESLNFVGFGMIFWVLITVLLFQLGVVEWPFGAKVTGGVST